MRLAFIDTETTGLDENIHEVWEFAAVFEDDTFDQFFIQPDHLGHADPEALRVGRYAERFTDPLSQTAATLRICDLLEGCVVVASNAQFDMRFIHKMLGRIGVAPTWHYRVLDVQSVWLGYQFANGTMIDIPWPSGAPAIPDSKLAPDSRHTALGDAYWNREIWNHLAWAQALATN